MTPKFYSAWYICSLYLPLIYWFGSRTLTELLWRFPLADLELPIQFRKIPAKVSKYPQERSCQPMENRRRMGTWRLSFAASTTWKCSHMSYPSLLVRVLTLDYDNPTTTYYCRRRSNHIRVKFGAWIWSHHGKEKDQQCLAWDIAVRCIDWQTPALQCVCRRLAGEGAN